MPEGHRAGAVPSETRQTEEVLRLRLEGRVELLESALRRYRLLSEALSARGWRRRLRDDPALLREVLELEPALPEALERTERRGAQEGWPEGSSIPRTARRVRELREELSARARKRLATLLFPSEGLSLEGCLRRLEALQGESLDLERTAGEPFALHLGSVSGKRKYVVSVLYVLGSLGLWGLMWLLLGSGNWGLALGVGLPAMALWLAGAVALLRRWVPGAVWLTPERLLWMAPGDEPPVSVRWDALSADAIQQDGREGLIVRGGQVLQVSGLGRQESARLRTLLEVFRDERVRAQAKQVDRPVELLRYPALLRRGAAWTEGQAVMTGRGVYFLPDPTSGVALLRAATGRSLDSQVELDWVLEGLRWQPASELDTYLVRAVAEVGGAAWSSSDARVAWDIPLEQEVHLSRGPEVLVGKVGFDERDLAHKLLSSWGGTVQAFARKPYS
ncbi:hypothetical protein MYSTI_06983 [Myxococcus stipitatus DSM 14675]|uniref:Uncharacterized protein n=1 Tax=Myxococcus stipitatus (strain DSM 14675 / JCM 12634 / Mx s8) TaxID=1278073 RepID=L7UK19_MYXSD|nr:hypothetical protein MYSTI_06983 [Myxococcus stipitatus DSM 14675]